MAFAWQDFQYPTSEWSILTCFVSFAQLGNQSQKNVQREDM